MSDDVTKENAPGPWSIISLLGRVCISILFIFSGVGKLLDFDQAIQEMASHHLPLPAGVAAVVIIVQLGGSALLITRRYARLGAGLLGLFTLAATVIGHTSLGQAPPTLELPQLVLMLMNLAIFGGFLSIAAQRPRR